MKAATVLGAGELGTACAMALATDGISPLYLLTRDAAQAPVSAKASAPPALPPAVRLCSISKALRGDAHLAIFHEQPHFLCTPITSYLPPDDAWAATSLGKEHSPVTHALLQQWGRQHSAGRSSTTATESSVLPFVCAFTRGFTADGGVAAQLADELVNGAAGRDAPSGAGAVPVLVAAGPLLAKEWAVQCTPVVTSSSGSGASSPSSSIPPRPQSALAGGDDSGSVASVPEARKTNGVAVNPAAAYPHAFSGISLAFATWTPSVHGDAGRQAALAAALVDLFPRESVTFLHEPDAAAVLSIVNGCAPLCSFGAGLVSSVYAGTNVTALASYAQHAVAATEQLTNDLLGRPAGTPLPIAAWSTLHCACTSLVSREFAFGRQLDFYFRKQDAVQAVFRGRTHHVFAATVDGLHTRMRAGGISSPFYEVLMDTYNTMLRASSAGEGLVKVGYYDYRDAQQGDGTLLRHAMRVDAAMLSGEEERFTAAKERMVEAFSSALMH